MFLLFVCAVTPAAIDHGFEDITTVVNLLLPHLPQFHDGVTNPIANVFSKVEKLGGPGILEINYGMTQPTLDMTDAPRVKPDPEFLSTNPHLLENDVRHTIQSCRLWTEQRARIKELLKLLVENKPGRWMKLIKIILLISEIFPDVAANTNMRLLQQVEKMELKRLVRAGRINDLCRLLKVKLDCIETTKLETILEHLSPKELVEMMAKATQLQQQVAQQARVERIERLQQVKVEAGESVLRRIQQDTEDKGQEKLHLLLALLVWWFLLCYCSEGTVQCVDVELTFGLSLVLSEIILLLGGDIEKNPGPLTGNVLMIMKPHMHVDPCKNSLTMFIIFQSTSWQKWIIAV